MTQEECQHLIFAGELITFETGMRFLTDHLNGDRYFRTSRPDHNLDRCRTQLKLVDCIEGHSDELEHVAARALAG